MLASPALSILKWQSNKGPLETLAWYEQHRNPGDSIVYASAVYHAGHARASNMNRWSPSGYATLGIAGTLVGLALLLRNTGAPRRLTQRATSKSPER